MNATLKKFDLSNINHKLAIGSKTIVFSANSTLLMYSDGLTEARCLDSDIRPVSVTDFFAELSFC